MEFFIMPQCELFIYYPGSTKGGSFGSTYSTLSLPFLAIILVRHQRKSPEERGWKQATEMLCGEPTRARGAVEPQNTSTFGFVLTRQVNGPVVKAQ